MEKKRRRKGLGGHDTARPDRFGAVQRARLWAITCTGCHPVGGEAARGEMVQPHAVLEVSDGVLDPAWRRWSASSARVSPSRSVMKASCRSGEEGQLGTGRGLHAPDDEPHRPASGALEGSVAGFGHIGGALIGQQR